MNGIEHILDDSPLTKEKVSELKKSAEEMLRDLDAIKELDNTPKPAVSPA